MKLIIGVVFVVIALVLILRMRNRSEQEEVTGTGPTGTLPELPAEFHAVSIRPGLVACAAVRSVQGERFLSASAPRLPLPDCDADDCRCRFLHHDDRRDGDDRRSPFRSTIGLDLRTVSNDQRSESDRRSKSDPDDR